MKFLSTLLLLGGYMLIYAAIAKGGKFAVEPWEGLFHDAYDTGSDKQPSQPSQPSQPRKPPSGGGHNPVGGGGVPFNPGAPFRRHP